MNSTVKLKMAKISKKFPGVKVLDDVTFEANSGEVTGLVGVNGAGKSTLMNILGGIFPPDEGEIYIDGEKIFFDSPEDADNKGIGFIHQELLFFSSMTVAENVYISHLFKNKVCPLFINKKLANEEAKKYLKMMGAEISPTSKLEYISPGERQVVEIARALAMGSEIIIFDEPTSSLSLNEKDKLFEVIKSLKKDGKTIIYISHFLNEIMEICDSFFVLRNGKINGQDKIKNITKDDIIRMIIGKAITLDKRKEKAAIARKSMLKVENIRSGNVLKDISFCLNEGEILGIWGLMGSGRTEIVRAMLGLDKIDSGEMYISENGEMKRISPRKLLGHCGYITENRIVDGLFLSQPIWKNITATSLKNCTSGIFNFLNIKKEFKISRNCIDLMKIITPSHITRVENLSGGNQQKVVFSKWLNKKARIYIMDEPTKGVDVGAKLEIHNLIKELAEGATSVLLISSEIEEMVSLSDRVLVLREGRIVGDITGREIKESRLMQMSLGGVSAVE